MLILGVDTSGQQGSIALGEAGSGHFRALEVVPLVARSYSALLIPILASLLDRHRLLKTDIESFAVVSGPGSFTGLRVGLSTVKALGTITGRPIAAVSRLEAIALSGHREGRAIAALDAGRGEVYLGNYLVHAGDCRQVWERLVNMEELVSLELQEACVVTPDESVIKALQARELAAHLIPSPQADLVAEIGARKISAGHTVSPVELDANYIRRSDAELFTVPKLLS